MEQIEACGVLCTLGPRTLTRDVEERKGEQTHTHRHRRSKARIRWSSLRAATWNLRLLDTAQGHALASLGRKYE